MLLNPLGLKTSDIRGEIAAGLNEYFLGENDRQRMAGGYPILRRPFVQT